MRTDKLQPSRRVLVCGGGGFIGSHLARRLKSRGSYIRAADRKKPEFSPSAADEFLLCDLRNPTACAEALDGVDEVYQLAAEMGGAGYVFTGENDAEIMLSSGLINLNILSAARRTRPRIFFSSSACIYPARNQKNPLSPDCSEDSAYPASPDSEYGWEKLFAERLYLASARNWGLDIRIARFHNIFGPEGAWRGGREKAPAALCRKIAEVEDGGVVTLWGDGWQTRSFLYIDEALDGVERLMSSGCGFPLNIGSEEMVSIRALAEMIARIAGKRIRFEHVSGPQGVRGRNSNNRLVRETLGWAPSEPLHAGIERLYQWISAQVLSAKEKKLCASA